ncbi:hypothetical protein FA15DRAFT_8331 [Coprinopsis marcescibilis]|uniref:Uncharacterized protein n=1 Tax=Coprinopsis marcescibilis TaxID=230819 RepID=A0A5C3LCE6_COPMA|nr:hypothetical protein FA15DRAFT_8331 [Coprinopsis marcescibilis]
MSFDAEAYASMQNNAAATSRARKESRRQSTPSGPLSAPQPRKSALKKTSQPVTATPMVSTMDFPQSSHYSGYPITPLTRTRTNSIGHANHESRRRANSNAASNQDHGGIDPPFVPLHLFISFQGYNELRLENITELALRELREKIWPMWPDGVESQPISVNECLVKFRNHPWDMAGPNHLIALRMLHELFTLCCRRGYVFQTAINTGHQQIPRLIFQVQTPDPHSQFFLAYFSSSGRRLTIVNAPSHVDLSLPVQLKSALPRKISTELTTVGVDNLRIIEIKRGINSSGLSSPLLCHLLKLILNPLI